MKQWRKWLVIFSSTIIVITLIFIINQLIQLYHNLAMIHPWIGTLVILALTLALLYVIFITVRGILRLPKEIELADGAEPEEYASYVELSLVKLKHNPTLKEIAFDWEAISHLPEDEQIQLAHQELRQLSILEIKEQAQTVFLSTAISQNGALDSLTVLLILTRMVWRLINHYDKRPTLGKILSIYSNVAATILMARGIEDLDLIEAQMEPLITSILGGSLLSMIPGSVSITNLIANSIVEGSINALLTLRVGIITIDYLGTLKDLDNNYVKRSATLEATKMLGSIIKEGSVNVVQVMMKSVKNAGVQSSRKWNPFTK